MLMQKGKGPGTGAFLKKRNMETYSAKKGEQDE